MTRSVFLLACLALAGCEVRNGVLVRNVSGHDLERLSLAGGDSTLVLGPLAAGATKSLAFVPTQNAHFTICADRFDEETCADYGYGTRNLFQAHRFEVLRDEVRYTTY